MLGKFQEFSWYFGCWGNFKNSLDILDVGEISRILLIFCHCKKNRQTINVCVCVRTYIYACEYVDIMGADVNIVDAYVCVVN